jgi:hypothetical protein
MTTRRRYHPGNTAHLCRPLPVSYAGARPNDRNPRQSCIRDHPAVLLSGTAIASTPRLPIDPRRNCVAFARSPAPSTALNSPSGLLHRRFSAFRDFVHCRFADAGRR